MQFLIVLELFQHCTIFVQAVLVKATFLSQVEELAAEATFFHSPKVFVFASGLSHNGTLHIFYVPPYFSMVLLSAVGIGVRKQHLEINDPFGIAN